MNASARTSARPKYNSMDLCKYFMALCVVAIHTQPLCTVDSPRIQEIYSAVVRMAVPFFFLASGFLLAVKMEEPLNAPGNLSILKDYIRKTIRLYIIWTLIYLPWTIHSYRTYDMSLWDSLVDFLRGFFLLGEHSITWMLWYLLSTIYSLTLIWLLLCKRIAPRLILGIGVFLLLTGFAIDEFIVFSVEELAALGGPLSGLLVFGRKVIDHTIRHGRMFPGVFYLTCGMLLATGIYMWCKRAVTAPPSCNWSA